MSWILRVIDQRAMKHKLEKGESSGLPALSWNTARMASRSIKKKKKMMFHV